MVQPKAAGGEQVLQSAAAVIRRCGMSKFTKEFIAEQRKIKPASKLPFEQKWEMVPILAEQVALFDMPEPVYPRPWEW
jgi:hypothetical protein